MKSFTYLNDKLEQTRKKLSDMWSEIPITQAFDTSISTNSYRYYDPSPDFDKEVTHDENILKSDWDELLYRTLRASLYSNIVRMVNNENNIDIDFEELHKSSQLSAKNAYDTCKECAEVESLWDNIDHKIADAVCYESPDSAVIEIIEEYEKSHETTALSAIIESCYTEISKELDELYQSVEYFAEQELNKFDDSIIELGIPVQFRDLFYRLADDPSGEMPETLIEFFDMYDIDKPIDTYVKWCEENDTDPYDTNAWYEFINSLE